MGEVNKKKMEANLSGGFVKNSAWFVGPKRDRHRWIFFEKITTKDTFQHINYTQRHVELYHLHHLLNQKKMKKLIEKHNNISSSSFLDFRFQIE